MKSIKLAIAFIFSRPMVFMFAISFGCASAKSGNFMCPVLAESWNIEVTSLPRYLATRVAVSPETFNNYQAGRSQRKISFTGILREKAIAACDASILADAVNTFDARSRFIFMDQNEGVIDTVYIDSTATRLLWRNRVFTLSGPFSSILEGLAWVEE